MKIHSLVFNNRLHLLDQVVTSTLPFENGEIQSFDAPSTSHVGVMQSSDSPASSQGSFENEDRSTKHPNLENEAPKTRKRST